MSVGPGGETGKIVEAIMAELKPHLLPDAPGQATHYNLAFEAVAGGVSRFGVLICSSLGQTLIEKSDDFLKWARED